jgi:hypothetical protein
MSLTLVGILFMMLGYLGYRHPSEGVATWACTVLIFGAGAFQFIVQIIVAVRIALRPPQKPAEDLDKLIKELEQMNADDHDLERHKLSVKMPTVQKPIEPLPPESL